MATTAASAAPVQRSPPPPSANPPYQKPNGSTTVLRDLLRGPGPSSSSHGVTACPLFPTESEDYYCLSCYTRCSGLALLVGPHTNHDYLPFHDAVLYMPAALLRETQEVVRESAETFAKPWRVQDQQREETLTYLLRLRESKVAAMARLLEEIQHVDQQLLHTTEAKALDLSNWRYQQRALRRKLEKLRCGADTLSASCHAEDTAVTAAVRADAAPSWQHSQQTAQKELAEVRRLLTVQLRQLDTDEEATHRQLATWHRMIASVPQRSVTKETTVPTSAATASGEQTAPFTDTSTVQPTSPEFSPAPKASPPDVVASPSVDPSSAEVVLLQHALLNINDGLRHRLLRAAAASLTSSSSAASSRSRLPSSSHDGSAPYTPVVGTADTTTGETVNSSLPLLPDPTPLRAATNTASSVTTTHVVEPRQVPVATTAGVATAVSPSPPQSTRVAALGVVDTLAAAVAAADDDDDGPQRTARWQSWRAREQALKASLNQLILGATTSTFNDVRNNYSSFNSFLERSGGEYEAISAMSGPLSSISALQHDPLDY